MLYSLDCFYFFIFIRLRALFHLHPVLDHKFDSLILLIAEYALIVRVQLFAAGFV